MGQIFHDAYGRVWLQYDPPSCRWVYAWTCCFTTVDAKAFHRLEEQTKTRPYFNLTKGDNPLVRILHLRHQHVMPIMEQSRLLHMFMCGRDVHPRKQNLDGEGDRQKWIGWVWELIGDKKDTKKWQSNKRNRCKKIVRLRSSMTNLRLIAYNLLINW